MAISFVAAFSAFSNSGTSLTFTLPSVSDGDFAVLAVGVKSTAGTATATGWTQIDPTLDRSDATSTKTLFLKRTLTAAESGATLTVTVPNLKCSGVGMVFRGVNASAPLESYASQANTQSTSVTAPSLTPSDTGRASLWFGTTNVGTSCTPPTNYTEPANADRASGGGSSGTRETTASAYRLDVAASATGTIVGTMGSSGANVGAHLLLAPTSDLTVSVTGVSGTGSTGSLAESIMNPDALIRVGSTSRIIATAFTALLTVAPTGASGTGSVGTVTVNILTGATATPTGVSGTGSVGSVTVSTGADALIRVGSTSRVIATAFTDGIFPTITGVSGTSALGTVVAGSTSAITVSVTGVSGTGYANSVVEGMDPTLEPDGVSGTGAVGTVIAAAQVLVNPTGVNGTASVGTVSAFPNQNITHVVTGLSATGSVGTVFVALAPTIAVTGVSGTGGAGFLSVATNNTLTVAVGGMSGTSALGSVATRGDVSPAATGVSGTASVGTASGVVSGNVIVQPVGVVGFGGVGFSLILGVDVSIDPDLLPVTPQLTTTMSTSTSPDAIRRDLNTLAASTKQATNENPYWTERWTEEVIVLTDLASDSATLMLPANSVISHVTTIVTQAIGGASQFKVGDTVTDDRFSALQGGVALGDARVCLDHYDTNSQKQSTADSVRITTDLLPTSGAVLVRVYFTQIALPTLG